MKDAHGHWAVLKIANRHPHHNATRVGVPIDVLHELHVLKRIQDRFVIRLLAFELSYTDLCLWKTKDSASVNVYKSPQSTIQNKPEPAKPADKYSEVSFRPFTYLLLESGEENMAEWRQKQGDDVSPGSILKAARDMFCALSALHKFDICHNDLKPENFIRIGCDFKLSDFGIATHANAYKLKRSEVHPKMFRAPELILNSTYYDYTTSVDIWAAGLILCILFFGGVNCRSSVITSATNVYAIMAQIMLAIGPPDETFVSDCKARYGDQEVKMDTKIIEMFNQSKDMSGLSHDERQASLHAHFTQCYGEKNCQKVIQRFTETVYREFLDLVAHCLQYNAEKRPSAQGCLSHPLLLRISDSKQHISPSSIIPRKDYMAKLPHSIGLKTRTNYLDMSKETVLMHTAFGKTLAFLSEGKGKHWTFRDERDAILMTALYIFESYVHQLVKFLDPSEKGFYTEALGFACVWLSAKHLSNFSKSMCIALLDKFDTEERRLLQQVVKFEILLANHQDFAFPVKY